MGPNCTRKQPRLKPPRARHQPQLRRALLRAVLPLRVLALREHYVMDMTVEEVQQHGRAPPPVDKSCPPAAYDFGRLAGCADDSCGMAFPRVLRSAFQWIGTGGLFLLPRLGPNIVPHMPAAALAFGCNQLFSLACEVDRVYMAEAAAQLARPEDERGDCVLLQPAADRARDAAYYSTKYTGKSINDSQAQLTCNALTRVQDFLLAGRTPNPGASGPTAFGNMCATVHRMTASVTAGMALVAMKLDGHSTFEATFDCAYLQVDAFTALSAGAEQSPEVATTAALLVEAEEQEGYTVTNAVHNYVLRGEELSGLDCSVYNIASNYEVRRVPPAQHPHRERLGLQIPVAARRRKRTTPATPITAPVPAPVPLLTAAPAPPPEPPAPTAAATLDQPTSQTATELPRLRQHAASQQTAAPANSRGSAEGQQAVAAVDTPVEEQQQAAEPSAAELRAKWRRQKAAQRAAAPPELRVLQRQQDAARHAAARADPEVGAQLRLYNTAHHAAARTDPEVRAQEQLQNTVQRAVARANPEVRAQEQQRNTAQHAAARQVQQQNQQAGPRDTILARMHRLLRFTDLHRGDVIDLPEFILAIPEGRVQDLPGGQLPPDRQVPYTVQLQCASTMAAALRRRMPSRVCAVCSEVCSEDQSTVLHWMDIPNVDILRADIMCTDAVQRWGRTLVWRWMARTSQGDAPPPPEPVLPARYRVSRAERAGAVDEDGGSASGAGRLVDDVAEGALEMGGDAPETGDLEAAAAGQEPAEQLLLDQQPRPPRVLPRACLDDPASVEVPYCMRLEPDLPNRTMLVGDSVAERMFICNACHKALSACRVPEAALARLDPGDVPRVNHLGDPLPSPTFLEGQLLGRGRIVQQLLIMYLADRPPDVFPRAVKTHGIGVVNPDPNMLRAQLPARASDLAGAITVVCVDQVRNRAELLERVRKAPGLQHNDEEELAVDEDALQEYERMGCAAGVRQFQDVVEAAVRDGNLADATAVPDMDPVRPVQPTLADPTPNAGPVQPTLADPTPNAGQDPGPGPFTAILRGPVDQPVEGAPVDPAAATLDELELILPQPSNVGDDGSEIDRFPGRVEDLLTGRARLAFAAGGRDSHVLDDRHPAILTLCFPQSFPYGFSGQRPRGMSFPAYCRHLLHRVPRTQFGGNLMLLARMYDICVRHESMAQVGITMNMRPHLGEPAACVPRDVIRAMGTILALPYRHSQRRQLLAQQSPLVKALVEGARLSTLRLDLTDAYYNGARSKMRAAALTIGWPPLFFTVNPADMHAACAVVASGQVLDFDDDGRPQHIPSTVEKWRRVKDDPYSCAALLVATKEVLVEELFGFAPGAMQQTNPRCFCGLTFEVAVKVEQSGRLALHIHGVAHVATFAVERLQALFSGPNCRALALAYALCAMWYPSPYYDPFTCGAEHYVMDMTVEEVQQHGRAPPPVDKSCPPAAYDFGRLAGCADDSCGMAFPRVLRSAFQWIGTGGLFLLPRLGPNIVPHMPAAALAFGCNQLFSLACEVDRVYMAEAAAQLARPEDERGDCVLLQPAADRARDAAYYSTKYTGKSINDSQAQLTCNALTRVQDFLLAGRTPNPGASGPTAFGNMCATVHRMTASITAGMALVAMKLDGHSTFEATFDCAYLQVDAFTALSAGAEQSPEVATTAAVLVEAEEQEGYTVTNAVHNYVLRGEELSGLDCSVYNIASNYEVRRVPPAQHPHRERLGLQIPVAARRRKRTTPATPITAPVPAPVPLLTAAPAPPPEPPAPTAAATLDQPTSQTATELPRLVAFHSTHPLYKTHVHIRLPRPRYVQLGGSLPRRPRPGTSAAGMAQYYAFVLGTFKAHRGQPIPPGLTVKEAYDTWWAELGTTEAGRSYQAYVSVLLDNIEEDHAGKARRQAEYNQRRRQQRAAAAAAALPEGDSTSASDGDTDDGIRGHLRPDPETQPPAEDQLEHFVYIPDDSCGMAFPRVLRSAFQWIGTGGLFLLPRLGPNIVPHMPAAALAFGCNQLFSLACEVDRVYMAEAAAQLARPEDERGDCVLLQPAADRARDAAYYSTKYTGKSINDSQAQLTCNALTRVQDFLLAGRTPNPGASGPTAFGNMCATVHRMTASITAGMALVAMKLDGHSTFEATFDCAYLQVDAFTALSAGAEQSPEVATTAAVLVEAEEQEGYTVTNAVHNYVLRGEELSGLDCSVYNIASNYEVRRVPPAQHPHRERLGLQIPVAARRRKRTTPATPITAPVPAPVPLLTAAPAPPPEPPAPTAAATLDQPTSQTATELPRLVAFHSTHPLYKTHVHIRLPRPRYVQLGGSLPRRPRPGTSAAGMAQYYAFVLGTFKAHRGQPIPPGLTVKEAYDTWWAELGTTEAGRSYQAYVSVLLDNIEEDHAGKARRQAEYNQRRRQQRAAAAAAALPEGDSTSASDGDTDDGIRGHLRPDPETQPPAEDQLEHFVYIPGQEYPTAGTDLAAVALTDLFDCTNAAGVYAYNAARRCRAPALADGHGAGSDRFSRRITPADLPLLTEATKRLKRYLVAAAAGTVEADGGAHTGLTATPEMDTPRVELHRPTSGPLVAIVRMPGTPERTEQARMPIYVHLPQPPSIDDTIELFTLAPHQAVPFMLMARYFDHRDEPNPGDPPQMLVEGKPGTGKSQFVQALLWYTFQHGCPHWAATCAYSWAAATAFSTPVHRSLSTHAMFALSAGSNRADSVRKGSAASLQVHRNVGDGALIIDEIGMNSLDHLGACNQSCTRHLLPPPHLAGDHPAATIFSGRPSANTGDEFQHPKPGGPPLYKYAAAVECNPQFSPSVPTVQPLHGDEDNDGDPNEAAAGSQGSQQQPEAAARRPRAVPQTQSCILEGFRVYRSLAKTVFLLEKQQRQDSSPSGRRLTEYASMFGGEPATEQRIAEMVDDLNSRAIVDLADLAHLEPRVVLQRNEPRHTLNTRLIMLEAQHKKQRLVVWNADHVPVQKRGAAAEPALTHVEKAVAMRIKDHEFGHTTADTWYYHGARYILLDTTAADAGASHNNEVEACGLLEDGREPADDGRGPYRRLKYLPAAVIVRPISGHIPGTVLQGLGDYASRGGAFILSPRASCIAEVDMPAAGYGTITKQIRRLNVPLGDRQAVTDYFVQGRSFKDECWLVDLALLRSRKAEALGRSGVRLSTKSPVQSPLRPTRANSAL
ncbi:hypothetical protein VOLCADRAFT_93997 [Volvox carteri f. nagariensis]|uniref:Uncharacterized protein n=1 Tax=Volvox carteri f. nagariensis TaxID=3068 RepID=D8U3M8_VOLCA|nr:uncharacterized protein VOLCADRAFT_93997 [Volvox carteri f. nagariensis]EFJ45557.1 hypothetical protein VOLCADRAFT_93997 [Volvox carteri f. nagariensis]|eukprot:XP_002953247.1 hypothetical protein VOLCADRAFT_93997 [Volvox carteri f. nagariensis]